MRDSRCLVLLLSFFTCSDHQNVISHHFQSAAILRLKNLPGPSGFTEVFVCCSHPSKLTFPWGCRCWWGCRRAEQPAFQELPSPAVPETVLHNLLLFDTGNEPRGKKGGENDALRNMCELHCCVSPVLLSSFSVVLFRTISSSLFFCSSPLVPTALKVSLLRDSHSFYFGRRKDGKYPACRQHMNGKLAASYFFFFF